MAHCGFEGTAVNDAFSHPLKALTVWMRGPKIKGAMAPDLPIKYTDADRYGTVASIPLSDIKRASRESV
jgi:hypothetical protein